MLRKSLFIVAILSIGLLILLMNNQPNFDDLSEEQLENAGYYTYSLPSDTQSDWERIISMKSFDWHCEYDSDSQSYRWNYIEVKYEDDSNTNRLTIRFSPIDALFDKENARSIRIELVYFDTEAFYYESGAIHNVLLIDSSELEAVISSQLPLEDMTPYIESLLPIGRYIIGNPWDSCS